MDYTYLFLAGILGGFLSGLLGLGGGLVYVVILNFYLEKMNLDDLEVVKYTVSNSAFAIFFAGISGSIQQIRSKNFYFKQVLTTAITSTLCSVAIAYWILKYNSYSKEKYYVLFIVVILFIFFKMLFLKQRTESFKDDLSKWKFLLVGSFTGFLSSLSGLGGGAIAVPLMNAFFKLKIKKATSISLGVMPFFTFFVTLFYAFGITPNKEVENAVGYILPKVVFSMSFGVIVASPLGVYTAQKLKPKTISIIFSAVLMCLLIKMFWELLYL